MTPFAREEDLADLLKLLDNPEIRGIHIIGHGGAGKTTLVKQLDSVLQARGRRTVFVPARDLPRTGRLLHAIAGPLSEGTAISTGESRVVNVSSGISIGDVASTAASVAAFSGARPVLILDGLDEIANRSLTSRLVRELRLLADELRIVVTSRPVKEDDGLDLRQFKQVLLSPFDEPGLMAIARAIAPDRGDDELRMIAKLSGGSPFLASLAARYWRENMPTGAPEETWSALFERSFVAAVGSAPDPDLMSWTLEILAIEGGRGSTRMLAHRMRIAREQVRRLVESAVVEGLLSWDRDTDTVLLVHQVFTNYIVRKLILPEPFRLGELRFGREEAERDDQLDASFVPVYTSQALVEQGRSIIIGDRGSGKSAIFRQLDRDLRPHTVPMTQISDLLGRIVAPDNSLDADAIAAAWLTMLTAAAIPADLNDTPRSWRRDAAKLRAAFGMSWPEPNWGVRLVRKIPRLFGGVTVKLGMGPVSFETNLPDRAAKSSVDVESLLHQTDELLGAQGREVMVLLDRIDEPSKYHRDRQQTLIQGLLQAESKITQMQHIKLAVFIRTDLFELYDLQEKNKLVTRTLVLRWSEDDWIRVLVRRAFANRPLQHLAARYRVSCDDELTWAALEVLFPSVVEGLPVERWLIESLRNGNGDLAPRLAVLLLHLVRDESTDASGYVATLPLFTAEALERAMTRLSNLSFDEVVNDFKVATTFVRNCRAAKYRKFTLDEVKALFDPAEGEVAIQISQLERLGFLERIVEEQDSQQRSLFRIPPLYTRCFDHE